MRPASLLFWLLLLGRSGAAQNEWTRISDPANPLATYTVPGVYHGAAWIDVNNDGWLDLFAAPNGLFLGQGNGTFKAMPTAIGNNAAGQKASGCSWADLDNDGDPDVVLAQFPSAVYRNDGAGHFTDITALFPGLANYAAWGCALGDLNNDQRLDVVLVHAAGFHPAAAARQPCKLFVQTAGPLGFTPVTGYAFTDSLGAYTVPYWADFDLDGKQDLFIAAGAVKAAKPDFCYRNLGAQAAWGPLQRLLTPAFAAQPQDGQCYNFVDVDNDGDLDLCLTNYRAAPTRLYLNEDGRYVATTTPFSTRSHHLTNCWGDFDLDGDQDVFITSDSLATAYYRNDGGRFTAMPGLVGPAGASGLVAGDYDNDGDLDVYITGLGPAQGLYRNDLERHGRSWLSLALAGAASNRSALGARVSVKAQIQGKATWQLRTVSAQNAFQGQNDLRVHFGLDQARRADSLLVVWPSGRRQRLGPLAPNHCYALTEGGRPVRISTPRPTPIPSQRRPAQAPRFPATGTD
ncbi:CRTAC1 family protein [Hymenobacter terricola]|uniref:CRTAC1 family protein n=1 Tax=Hymenobacter terricola TaxID=2819236 RepID=UPI001B30FF67|nr:CRTAC1 family protein [Hymenobacter terricola]